MPDSRQRYNLARDLAALSPNTGLGTWVRLLEQAGVIMSGVPAGVAASVEQRLAAAGCPATLRAHEAAPAKRNRTRSRWLPWGGAGLVAVSAVVLAFELRSGPGRSPKVAVTRPTGIVPVQHQPESEAESSTDAEAQGSPTLSPRTVAARIMPGVVVLRCKQQSGSGFFVADRRVLTNAHVLCGRDESLAAELADGSKDEAKVIKLDERLDLALLETSLTGTPLPIASAGDLAAGDTVMTAGAPQALDRSFNVGAVSNARRILLGVCHLQVDARINDGNSGGPLVDARGNVVGVVAMKQEQAEGIGFAIPIDYAFDGDGALLAAPDWHPTAGFQDMLQTAQKDDERLVQEARQLSIRLVQAAFDGRSHVVAAMVSTGDSKPQQVLGFHFEQNGRTFCKMRGTALWFENNPREGLAKRASQWMQRMGFGKVYSGVTDLTVQDCPFARGTPIELVLEKDDEKINRVSL